MPKKCWYCQFFSPTDIGVSNSGECRRNAPCGLDANIATSSPSAIFPIVYDGTTEYCGDFVPNSESVTTPL